MMPDSVNLELNEFDIGLAKLLSLLLTFSRSWLFRLVLLFVADALLFTNMLGTREETSVIEEELRCDEFRLFALFEFKVFVKIESSRTNKQLALLMLFLSLAFAQVFSLIVLEWTLDAAAVAALTRYC